MRGLTATILLPVLKDFEGENRKSCRYFQSWWRLVLKGLRLMGDWKYIELKQFLNEGSGEFI